MMKNGADPSRRLFCWTPADVRSHNASSPEDPIDIKDPIDVYGNATLSQIYTAAEEELESTARTPDGEYFPSWALRYMLAEKFIATADRRLRAYAVVRHGPGDLFTVETKDITVASAKGEVDETLVAQISVRVRCKYQLLSRELASGML